MMPQVPYTPLAKFVVESLYSHQSFSTVVFALPIL